MSAPLDDIASYSTFVYSLAERHSFVTLSALALAPIGAKLAKLEGRISAVLTERTLASEAGSPSSLSRSLRLARMLRVL